MRVSIPANITIGGYNVRKIKYKAIDILSDLKMEVTRRHQLIGMKRINSVVLRYFKKGSDIDVIIILKEVNWTIEKDVYETCYYVGLNHEVVISPVVYSEGEINDKYTKVSSLFMAIEQEGINI